MLRVRPGRVASIIFVIRKSPCILPTHVVQGGEDISYKEYFAADFVRVRKNGFDILLSRKEEQRRGEEIESCEGGFSQGLSVKRGEARFSVKYDTGSQARKTGLVVALKGEICDLAHEGLIVKIKLGCVENEWKCIEKSRGRLSACREDGRCDDEGEKAGKGNRPT